MTLFVTKAKLTLDSSSLDIDVSARRHLMMWRIVTDDVSDDGTKNQEYKCQLTGTLRLISSLVNKWLKTSCYTRLEVVCLPAKKNQVYRP